MDPLPRGFSLVAAQCQPPPFPDLRPNAPSVRTDRSNSQPIDCVLGTRPPVRIDARIELSREPFTGYAAFPVAAAAGPPLPRC